MKLEGKVAVVTGGGGGIGRQICLTFAEQGAKVAVADMDQTKAEEVSGQIGCEKSAAWEMDVTDSKSVEAVADELEKKLGPIDIWINSAGISRVMPFLDCTEEIWNQIMAVNLKGTFIGCRAAVLRMLSRKHGVILNMSSQSGKKGSSHYQAYCASKFAVIGLTQSLAAEFSRSGIRINALCPGFVFTPLWEGQLKDYAAKKDMHPDEVIPYVQERIPLGRLCDAIDVANTAVFLASDDASYITGEAINLSGGEIMH